MAAPIMNQITDGQLKQITDTQLLQLIAWKLGAGNGGSGGGGGGTGGLSLMGFLIAPVGAKRLVQTAWGSTNNIETQSYYDAVSGGNLLAQYTFTYRGGGVANDDFLVGVVQNS